MCKLFERHVKKTEYVKTANAVTLFAELNSGFKLIETSQVANIANFDESKGIQSCMNKIEAKLKNFDQFKRMYNVWKRANPAEIISTEMKETQILENSSMIIELHTSIGFVFSAFSDDPKSNLAAALKLNDELKLHLKYKSMHNKYVCDVEYEAAKKSA
jgi:hypothetical protein